MSELPCAVGGAPVAARAALIIVLCAHFSLGHQPVLVQVALDCAALLPAAIAPVLAVHSAGVRSAHGVLSRALSHLLHRHLSVGWHTWRDGSQHRRRNALLVGRALGHLLHHGVAMAFGTWSERALERSASLQSVRRSMACLTNRKLAQGFRGWRYIVFVERQFGTPAARMARAFAHLSSHHLSFGWRSWALASRARSRRRSRAATHRRWHPRPQRSGPLRRRLRRKSCRCFPELAGVV